MSSSRAGWVLVRNKRTGKIDVRRANSFSSRESASNLDGTLHFIGCDRTRVCRCKHPGQHDERVIAVASECTHLNASLALYMCRLNLESCTIADFHDYRNHRESTWRNQGVDITAFHYTSHAKTKVCRCSRPTDHNAGTPRNIEIIEQCAEFFSSHKDAVVCSASQWRRVMEGDSSPVHPQQAVPPKYSQSAHSPEAFQDSFRFDSQSTQNLLEKCATRKAVSPDMKVRSDTFTPRFTQPPTGPLGDPDMPTEVWRCSRPSLWASPRSSNSMTTTPLGSVFPQHLSPLVPSSRYSDGQQGNCIQKEVWYQNASRDSSKVVIEVEPPLVLLQENDALPNFVLNNNSQPMPELHELHGRREILPEHRGTELHADAIVELSSNVTAAKKSVDPGRQIHQHIPTLEALCMRDTEIVSELPGKDHSVHVSQTHPHTANFTNPSTHPSLPPGQFHETSRLPCQEDFLLRHTAVSTPVNRLRGDKCTICNEPYEKSRKHVIILPECGHLLHEGCLLVDFRVCDQQVGTCPVCNVGLCSRTIEDRIYTDRRAIFGPQFTRLRCEVSVDFPQHNEVIKCASEEEVAAAQLRLIKDYVDVHAEEVFRRWELNRVEPDWFIGIVRPAIKLFQAWNAPDRENRYFPDQEAFFKLLAWAELVRLMQHGRKSIYATHGKDAMFPQLSDLHAKFSMARERYDTIKLSWRTDQSGTLACDLVIQDAINIALRSQ